MLARVISMQMMALAQVRGLQLTCNLRFGRAVGAFHARRRRENFGTFYSISQITPIIRFFMRFSRSASAQANLSRNPGSCCSRDTNLSIAHRSLIAAC